MTKEAKKQNLIQWLPRRDASPPADIYLLAEKINRNPRTVRRYVEELVQEREAPWFIHDNQVHLDRARSERIELDGYWFTSDELFSLLALYQMIEEMTPGLMTGHFQDIKQRILKLLGPEKESRHLTRHVKFLPIAQPPIESGILNQITQAIAQKQRLKMTFWHRARDEVDEREISPLQLVRYRDRWLVDAWCHLRDGLRSFSLEAIQTLAPTDTPAKPLPDAKLKAYYQSSYGIFNGTADKIAVLNFSAFQARWIKDQQWHPQQTAATLPDGRYQLQLPYKNDLELIQDILKFGPQVEVVSPPELRKKVKQQLQAALKIYETGGG